MNKQMKAVLTFSLFDIRQPLTIFWSVLIGFMLLGTGISFTLGQGTIMIFSSSVAVYIFCGISGFLTVRDTFPYNLKMGGTRRNYFVGISLYFLLLAIVMSAFHNVMITIFDKLVDVLKINGIQFFHFSTLTGLQDTWILRFFIDGVLALFVLIFFFFLGVMFFRFGLIGGYSVIAICAIAIILPQGRDRLIEFFIGFATNDAILQYIWLLGIGVVLLFITRLIMRKAPVGSAIVK
ncbi:hypothetical protein GCM10008967_33260 [Bacillus carboniphilus]|uniref:Uncharacterized protein n=1 Tax=Bacillus carboniphilus TaxID=86663 RepID=A0ABN0WK91_9BACI